MKVEAIYSPTIMSGPVVRFETGMNRGQYREIFSGGERTDWSAEINASRDGVSLQGDWPIYRQPNQIATLTLLLREAWRAHEAIKEAGRGRDHDVAKAIVESFNLQYAEGIAIAPNALLELST